MNQVLGEVPLTIKIRTGITNSNPLAHRLVTRMQSEWGLSAVTVCLPLPSFFPAFLPRIVSFPVFGDCIQIHGRSRQQRYKTKADYAYIGQVARTLRETAADNDLQPIPIFGNGDAYDYRTYYENMEASGVDGIMIARGALVKVASFLSFDSFSPLPKHLLIFFPAHASAMDLPGDQGTSGLRHNFHRASGASFHSGVLRLATLGFRSDGRQHDATVPVRGHVVSMSLYPRWTAGETARRHE